MNTVRTRWLTIALAVACVAGMARGAQGIPGFGSGDYVPPTPRWRGQAGMTFLQIGGSARAEALGGAYAAGKADLATIFYNPAGVAGSPRFSVYANHTSWIADMAVNNFAASTTYRSFTVGMTYVTMDYGEIMGTVIANNALGYEKTGPLSPSTWAAGGLLAARLTDRFNVGVHLRYAVQDFDDTRAYSFSRLQYYGPDTTNANRVAAVILDLGTQYDLGLRSVTINMALQNYTTAKSFVKGSPAGKFDFPLTYRVGLAGDAFEIITGDPNRSSKLMLYAEGIDQLDAGLGGAFGAEYVADLSFIQPGTSAALRIGRRPARVQTSWTGPAKVLLGYSLSFGGGIRVPLGPTMLTLDYAHGDYGPGLTTQRLALGISMK